jgi:hypothetical protein
MCFSKPNITKTDAPEATPVAPVVNGSDASANNAFKSKAAGVNALKIPLNVPSAGNGLQVPQ